MKKKSISVLLALVCTCTAVLAGCGSKAPAEESTGNKTETKETVAAEESVAEETVAVEESEAVADREEVTVSFSFYRGTQPTDAAVEAISEALTELSLEKFNTRIELNVVGKADYPNYLNLALAGGEQLDWIQFGASGMTLPTMYGSEQILKLDDYLTEDSAIMDYTTVEDLDCCRVGGDLVGIPAVKNKAASASVFFRADIIDELGLKDAVRNVSNLDDVEVILAKMKEAYPDKYPFCTNTGKINYKFYVDNLGDSTYLSGVLENPMEGTTVVDIHETQAYKEFCERMHRWYENGWIDPDYETSSSTVNALIQNGESFACFSNNNIDIANATEEEKLSSEASQGWTCQLYQSAVTPFYSMSAHVNNHGWSLAYTCEHPERAMEVFEWVFSDKEASTLLTQGLAGVHYDVDEEGYAVLKADTEYERLNWNGPNGYIALTTKGEGNINDLVLASNMTAAPSVGKGFMFDSSSVSAQVAAVANVDAKYAKGIQGGALDPAEYLPKFIEELKAAGIDDIIAEKQRQFDEWYASMNK